MKNRIRIARGTSEELRESTAKAELGVPFYDTTNKRLYIGKDNTTQLKDYTEDDSIVAYRAENADNAIVNSGTPTTYSGFIQDNNNILKANTNEIISKKILITNTETKVTTDTSIVLPITLSVGDIIELEYTCGNANSLSRFYKFRIGDNFTQDSLNNYVQTIIVNYLMGTTYTKNLQQETITVLGSQSFRLGLSKGNNNTNPIGIINVSPSIQTVLTIPTTGKNVTVTTQGLSQSVIIKAIYRIIE